MGRPSEVRGSPVDTVWEGLVPRAALTLSLPPHPILSLHIYIF